MIVGPGEQEVTYQWQDSTYIMSYLVQNKGYVGIKIDVRLAILYF